MEGQQGTGIDKYQNQPITSHCCLRPLSLVPISLLTLFDKLFLVNLARLELVLHG